MKIKAFTERLITKLKSALSRFKAFLTAKRFNLLSLLLILFLISAIGSCRIREPTTAKADTLVADDTIYYVLPSFQLKYNNTYVCSLVGSLVFEVDINNNLVVYRCNHSYIEGRLNFLYAPSNNNYVNDNLQGLYMTAYYTTFDNSYIYSDLNANARFDIVRGDLRSFTTSAIICYPEENKIVYQFYGENSYSTFEIVFPQSFLVYDLGFTNVPLFSVGGDINRLNDYQLGYEDGYVKGLETEWKDLSPFATLKKGVDDLLSISLFGDFTVGTILLIIFGFGTLFALLKLFVGG